MKYKNNEPSGSCLECGTTFYGRSDKKFCSLNCKNLHNNRLRDYTRKSNNLVYMSINKNYRLLDLLIKSGKSSISLETLLSMGFAPQCVTGLRNGEKGHKEFSCLDIVYYQSPKKLFNIHKKSDETNGDI